MNRLLVIQTAFIGDVILATAVLEKLHAYFPNAQIDMLVRKGNESLLGGHPFINTLLIWDKKKNKYANLFQILKQIRKTNYDVVINLQRFAASGFLTAFSGAKKRLGFNKNPFSSFFTDRFPHEIGNGNHEVDRNLQLVAAFTNDDTIRPKLYPSEEDRKAANSFVTSKYICLAPTSVWFTKQMPSEKWVELMDQTAPEIEVFLLGAPDDQEACQKIAARSHHPKVNVLAGKLSLLASAALMEKAEMNYVNDSAPLHLASAMNAPTTAYFCSTIPDFGFGPLSDRSILVETTEELSCRPCGLHGKKKCPLGHFQCGKSILIHPLDDGLHGS